LEHHAEVVRRRRARRCCPDHQNTHTHTHTTQSEARRWRCTWHTKDRVPLVPVEGPVPPPSIVVTPLASASCTLGGGEIRERVSAGATESIGWYLSC
jgi:hypothetical protein